ncbi:MAG: alanine:cation symporter family protein [Candidatus Marinimicrobia bacterium]|nr:alanine:cation symporter family protein [Candidatus Neomarinimicrobiota bacterium]MBL7059423.1 alanine:cation symporter family protein [Candidatus Neomarinimicrobiota bacterium]
MWGTPLLILLVGGGIYFTIYCRFIPFRYFKHAVRILTGKYDRDDDPGDITHFQALSSALASTVGMGNISGVAVAIYMGGPGALFWMWVSSIFGMATKFFTCTLSILYRGKDDRGDVQGGPMYVIDTGLNPKFKFLAVMFSVAGLIGCLSLFQANQLTQIIRDEIFLPNGLFTNSITTGNMLVGTSVAVLVGSVIFGGIKRIGLVASRLVPFMVTLYLIAGVVILFKHYSDIPSMLGLIIHDAFTGDAVFGGAVGSVIVMGIRRAAFSNEAGIGTEAMAHGAAKTKEPVREGLVAMIGPFIDTIVICTITGIVILSSGLWQSGETNGVTLTTQAFTQELGEPGRWLLMMAVIIFSMTTMIGYSYYGCKCTGYLFGTKWKNTYNYFYVLAIIFGAVISIDMVINILDGMFAVMAVPTMVSAIILSPKVMQEAKRYFKKIQ